MSPQPTNFQPASYSSSYSFRDAVASYVHSQYLIAGAVSSQSYEDDDLDAQSIRDVEEQAELEDEELFLGQELQHDHDFISQLEWDPVGGGEPIASEPVPRPPRVAPIIQISRPRPESPTEQTPLMHRRISFGADIRPQRPLSPGRRLSTSTTDVFPGKLLPHRISNASLKSSHPRHHGGSTYGQSLFNSIAILLGIGMLSEPFAFSYAGWIAGTLLIFVYGALSCYTAKILARMILEDPRLRSYSDIGRKAFGPRSTVFISAMFCLELFAVSVILVTLYGDSFHSIAPHFSSNTYKLMGLIVLIPTVYLPLSLLSYTSILGILATILIVVVVLIDGVSKKTQPGSFWDPAPTSIGPQSQSTLALSFGLFMAGFSGHAVIPSIARDMMDPTQFDHMINWAFVIATCLYALMGVAGYVMFGNVVSDEISADLIRTPGFNVPLNQVALVLLIIMPLSKFALNTQPLNATIQNMLGLEAPVVAPEDRHLNVGSLPWNCRANVLKILSVAQRCIVTLASVAVSVIIPEFSAMMAFLGSFSAFLLCIIGPLCARIAMTKRCSVIDAIIIVLATISAIWGTVAAFRSN